MDIDTLNAQSPRDVMAGDGPMIGYLEIFPRAEPFEFTRDGQHSNAVRTDPGAVLVVKALPEISRVAAR